MKSLCILTREYVRDYFYAESHRSTLSGPQERRISGRTTSDVVVKREQPPEEENPR